MKEKKKIVWAHMYSLIGGMGLAQEKVFGTKPAYILSTPGFQENDKHYINHLRKNKWKGKYYIMGAEEDSQNVIENATYSEPDLSLEIDVMGSTCPCAGLSSLSPSSKADNKKNDFMIESTEYILSKIRPKILWGENAPRLGTKMGRPVADKLYELCDKYEYKMLIYTTESRLHGNPQIRPRTFYFMFRNDYFDYIPLLTDVPFVTSDFEEFIKGELLETDEANITLQSKKPSEDPFYMFIKEFFGVATHRELIESVCGEHNNFDCVNTYELCTSIHDGKFGKRLDLMEWLKKHNFEKEIKRFTHFLTKRENNAGAWMHHAIIGRKIIPSYVAQLPGLLIHPYEDRYITLREGLRLMGFPEDFELVHKGNIKTQSNFICQNVPVGTASDMCEEILKMLDYKSEKKLNASYVIQRKKQRDYEIIGGTEKRNLLDAFF